MKSQLAPIVLFTYNRPQHTLLTLEALKKNILANQSRLFIYSDGIKEGASNAEISKIEEVRKIIRSDKWCKEVQIIESNVNQGLFKSIISGVTHIIDQFERIIVLEDDLITSRYFLTFMNKALSMYQDTSNVYSITGYMFDIPTDKSHSVLLPFISTWGWATWKEKWKNFDIDSDQKNIIVDSKILRKYFNLGDYDYVKMLKNQNQSSWGILWYYSVFVKHGLNLFPSKSLVKNIGTDGSGVNYTTKVNLKDQFEKNQNIEVLKTDNLDFEFYEEFLCFFSQKEKRTLFEALWKIIKAKSHD